MWGWSCPDGNEKEKILRCSKLNHSSWRVRERERDRTVSLSMAAGQLADGCSHSPHVCWRFGVIPRWLFPQIIPAGHHKQGEPLPQVRTSLLSDSATPEPAPLHLLPPLDLQLT